MNLWHDVPLGKNAPEEFNIIVEVPKGSQNKYEIDKETGLIKLDRANYSAAAYPCEYAFAPQTLWGDGDALDILVLATFPIPTGILVKVRPIAFMDMIDTGESDAKIICVPVNDRRFEHIQDLGDINPHTLQEIKHFFETYKNLKGNDPMQYVVTVPGFKGKAEAIEAINQSIAMYKEKFGK